MNFQLKNAHPKVKQRRFLRLVLAGLLLFSTAIFAQNIPELLGEYRHLDLQIQQRTAAVDSLNGLLAQQTARIDQEKQASSPDKSALREQMAEGLELSESINRQRRQLQQLQQKFNTCQSKLAARFAARIDSLKALQNDANFSGDETALQESIVSATANYLFFSPIFRELPFDPQKIAGMEPATTSDSLERGLMRDYLATAEKGVDERLAIIRNDRQKLESTIKLSRKAEEFLSDVSDENYSLFAQGMISTQRNEAFAASERDNLSETSFSPVNFSAKQLENISIFFAQLGVDRPASAEQSFKMAIESGSEFVSLEDYLDLLKTAETRLETFHKAITQKLEAKDAAQ